MARTKILVLLTITVVLIIGWGGQGRAETAAEFYKNNVTTIYASSKPGGGTDFAARFFVAYWQQYTGGFMRLINEPGGGGLVAGNIVYRAKPDGLTIGTGEFGGAIMGASLAKPQGIQFDAVNFGWIGFMAGEGYSFAVSTKLPYNTLDELKKAKNLVMAGQSHEGGGNIGASLVADVFGLDAMTLYGHEGSAEVGMAMARGELGAYAMNVSTIKNHLNKGWVKKPLVAIDTVRSVLFPDVPTIGETAKLSSDQKKVLTYFVSVLRAGKGFYATPGIPADRLEFLQSTFDKIMADKAFLSQAKLQWPGWEPPVSGKDLTVMVKEAASLTKDDIALAKKVVAKFNKK